MAGRVDLRPLGRHPLLIPLAISLLVGAIYAAMLPPWDLIDEEQHVHYIQYVAERRALPEMGQTYLSPEIVSSLFEVDRWQRMRLSRPPSDNPVEWGLEGLSYEAYQPPLFYLAFAPFYALLPDPMLAKLYAMRALVVLIGTLTVAGTFALVRIAWPEDRLLAVAAASLLPLIPERAMATARVNNDALAELLAALVFLLLVLCVKRGITARDGAAIGAALGLALLAKVSAASAAAAVLVVWVASYRAGELRRWLGRGAALAAAAIALSGWFFYRNLVTHGDLTGIGSFLLHARFSLDSSAPTVIGELLRGFWGLWWWNRPLYLVGLLSGAAFLVAMASVFFGCLRGRFTREQKVVLLALWLTVVGAVAGVWVGTAAGWVPSVQGRFLLPAYGPLITLTVLGLLATAPAGARIYVLGATFAAALAVNGYVLFNLLPYHYPFP